MSGIRLLYIETMERNIVIFYIPTDKRSFKYNMTQFYLKMSSSRFRDGDKENKLLSEIPNTAIVQYANRVTSYFLFIIVFYSSNVVKVASFLISSTFNSICDAYSRLAGILGVSTV